jgi:two-component system chemotaxis sensor kinase CheA
MEKRLAVKISEYKQLFLSEAQDILNLSNNVLVNLEKDPANLALLHELFRQCHTLKSMAQSMGYEEISRLTHAMEATLTLLRSGGLKAEKDTVDLLFKSLDTLSNLLAEIQKGDTKRVKTGHLVERFEEITSAAPKEERESRLELGEVEGRRMGEKQGMEIPSVLSFGEVQTIRVSLTQLDSIMDVAGELAINRIRLSQIAQTSENTTLEEAVAQMSRLTSQLQDQMMQVRLVPLEYIFTPYPRLVRDMAADQKKEVDFLIEGSHIGLDRGIQDEINEPLLHLLKNAVTHGIEEPEERENLRKPRRGKIKLAAKRERDFVVVELSDDGRGIDINEVKEVALSRGIITAEELSSLTTTEVMMLTTYAGYSGAKKVTEAAGRGVGLNASRLKVESLGGTLNIDTRPNEGTIFSIKLPLTMAIVQVLLVAIADETYCIPLSYIAETITRSPHDIKTIEHHEMISYRDTVLPLVRLREKFGFPPLAHQNTTSDISTRIPAIPIVVVGEGSKKVGLVVDSLLGQQEAVMRSLTGVLKEVKGASGATILGTGKVALIVDVPSLF